MIAADLSRVLDRAEGVLDDPTALLTTQERDELEAAVSVLGGPFTRSRLTKVPIGIPGKWR